MKKTTSKLIFIGLLLLTLWPAYAQTSGSYFYVVRAVGPTGVESVNTLEVTVSFAAISAAPNHTVVLSWTASTSTVASYNIYRSTTSGTGYIKIGSVPAGTLTYSDITVPPNPPGALSAVVS